MPTIEVRVPDIGDFKNVPVIEIHVAPGAEIGAEDPLVTLESDKATMDIPAPHAGKVAELKVKPGDKVSEGDLLMLMEGAAQPGAGTHAPGEGQAGYGSSAKQTEAAGSAPAQAGPAPGAIPGAKPEDGVMAHLINADPSRGLVASIIHLKPGTAIAAHSHEGFTEAHYALEGDLTNDGEEFGPGGYITHRPGVVHGPHSSKNGCRVLTVQTGHPGPEQSDHHLAGGTGQSSS